MRLYLPKFSQSGEFTFTYRVVSVLVIQVKVPVPYYFFPIVSPIKQNKGEFVLLHYGFGGSHGKTRVHLD